MPPAVCTVEGIVYDQNGQPAAGVSIRVRRIELSGTALETGTGKVAITNASGVICRVDANSSITETEGFEVPRNSDVWLYGTFRVGSQTFNVDPGVRVSIPDSATVDISTLGNDTLGPTSGLTVYLDDAPLSGLYNTFKFESDSAELEVESAGVLIIRPLVGEGGGGEGVSEALAIAYAVAL